MDKETNIFIWGLFSALALGLVLGLLIGHATTEMRVRQEAVEVQMACYDKQSRKFMWNYDNMCEYKDIY